MAAAAVVPGHLWGGSPYIGVPIILAVGIVLGVLALTGRSGQTPLSPLAIAAGALAAAALVGAVLSVTLHVQVHGLPAAEVSPGNRGVALWRYQQRQSVFTAGVIVVVALLVWRARGAARARRRRP